MSTSEEVFYLYERNKKIVYNSCSNLECCPNNYDNTCYCDSTDPVLPNVIGDTEFPCRLNVRIYIKHGEECSICLEPITSKSNAQLTSCGHPFHKTCLHKVFQIKWASKRKTPCLLNCPMCRQRVIEPEFEKYDFYSDNAFDKLENFWITKNFQTPKFCFSKKHYIGMKASCTQCNEYRNTGKWWDDY